MSGASYDPRPAAGLTAEVARLEEQAALAWPAERRLLERLGIAPGATVVEVGCGPGSFLARLGSLDAAARLVGVEPDAELAALARARVPEAQILAGRADALPLADDSADVAVVRLVLQHLADPVVAVAELRRVLRPGGLAIAIEVDGGLWGLAEPSFPAAAAVQAKAWTSQAARGGDRMIGRRLHGILTAGGLHDVTLDLYASHSDELGLDAFATHLEPSGLVDRMVDGTITPAELGVAHTAYRRFREDPGAYVLLVGFLASGRA